MGDSFSQSNSDNATGVQGSGNTVEVNHNYSSDPWQPVEEAVLAEVPEEDQESVSAHISELKEMVETERPESEYAGILEVLAPYKGVAKAIASVTATTVAGPILGPALSKIINAV